MDFQPVLGILILWNKILVFQDRAWFLYQLLTLIQYSVNHFLASIIFRWRFTAANLMYNLIYFERPSPSSRCTLPVFIFPSMRFEGTRFGTSFWEAFAICLVHWCQLREHEKLDALVLLVVNRNAWPCSRFSVFSNPCIGQPVSAESAKSIFTRGQHSSGYAEQIAITRVPRSPKLPDEQVQWVWPAEVGCICVTELRDACPPLSDFLEFEYLFLRRFRVISIVGKMAWGDNS